MSSLGSKILDAIGFEEAPQEEFEDTAPQDAPERKKAGKRKKAEDSKIIHLPGQEMRMRLYEPAAFESAWDIATDLEQNRPVVINLGGLEEAAAQRVVDFISGCLYTLRGKMQAISATLLLAVPADVEIETEGDTNR